MESSWFKDTLAKRIFCLMWFSLVASHLIAHQIVMGWIVPATPTIAKIEDLSVPSLPPLSGVFGTERHGRYDDLPPPGDDPEMRTPWERRGPPPDHGPGGQPGRGNGGNGPQPLPTYALAIDYAIRIAIIALFSVLGSRWLSKPIRHLVDASTGLTQRLGAGADAPTLDESQGTVEVKQAARIFNTMARQISELFRSRELLVASLSHDLRTPLTRIRVRMEPLPDSDMKARTISDIREMNSLIDDSMEVFRDATSTEVARRTDVFSLCQSIVDDAVEQHQSATITGQPAIATVRPMALKRVVTNLVTNAIRYGGNAMIGVSADESGVTITVDDNGPGIPADQLEKVMLPFYRLDSSRSRLTGGSGLGLYIARDLTSRLGGELSLANRATGGLRATIRLRHATA